MNTMERKKAIMRELQEKGSVNISEIAGKYGVSTMTIRRDLARFEKDGLVTVEYGGAVLNSGAVFEYNMTMKAAEHPMEKKAIAEKCVQYIQDGESVFLDAGTTTAEIAKLLPKRSNLLVLTNSLLAANILARSEDIRVVMCPGDFRQVSMAFMGPLTDAFIANLKIDRLFLAVEGISLEQGVTVPDIMDGTTKKTLVEHSKSVICVADHSKFGQEYLYRIAPLEQVDYLVTDQGLPEELGRVYEEKGVSLIRA